MVSYEPVIFLIIINVSISGLHAEPVSLLAVNLGHLFVVFFSDGIIFCVKICEN